MLELVPICQKCRLELAQPHPCGFFSGCEKLTLLCDRSVSNFVRYNHVAAVASEIQEYTGMDDMRIVCHVNVNCSGVVEYSRAQRGTPQSCSGICRQRSYLRGGYHIRKYDAAQLCYSFVFFCFFLFVLFVCFVCLLLFAVLCFVMI